MFCLPLALFCVGRCGLSAPELQRASLVFLGTALKQRHQELGPRGRLALTRQLFPLRSRAPETPAGDLQPYPAGPFFVHRRAHSTCNGDQHPPNSPPYTSVSPHAPCAQAMQGAGAFQTLSAMGSSAFQCVQTPWLLPRLYMGDDTHSGSALTKELLCFSRL